MYQVNMAVTTICDNSYLETMLWCPCLELPQIDSECLTISHRFFCNFSPQVSNAGQRKMFVVWVNESKTKTKCCPKANCKLEFGDEAELQTHIRERHTNTCPTCPDCGRKFTKQCNADEHWRSVHGNQVLSCKVEGCNKTFKWHSSMHDHLRTAHGHAKLVCGVGGCVWSSAYSQSLSKHKKMKHKVEPLQFVEVAVKEEALEDKAGMETEAVVKLESIVKVEDTVVEDITFAEEEVMGAEVVEEDEEVEVGARESPKERRMQSSEGGETRNDLGIAVDAGEGKMVKSEAVEEGDVGVMVVEEEDPLCSVDISANQDSLLVD